MGPATRKRGTGEGETDKQMSPKQQKSQNRNSATACTASESQSFEVGDVIYAADCGMLYKVKVLNTREVVGKDGERWGDCEMYIYICIRIGDGVRAMCVCIRSSIPLTLEVDMTVLIV